MATTDALYDFTSPIDPEHFAGRGALVSDVISGLRGGKSFLLYAPPKAGKTSTLFKLRQKFKAVYPDKNVTYIDFAGESAIPPSADVYLIDNVETASKDPAFSVLQRTRSDNPRAAYAFSSSVQLRNLEEKLEQILPEDAKNLPLGLLGIGDCGKIAKLSEDVISWDNSALSRLDKITGRHPYYLQIFCRLAFEEAKKRLVTSVQKCALKDEDIDALLDEAIKLSTGLITTTWAGLSPSARFVTATLAAHGECQLDYLFQTLGSEGCLPGANLQAILEDLQDRLILNRSGSELYLYETPFFVWIRREQEISSLQRDMEEAQKEARIIYETALGCVKRDAPKEEIVELCHRVLNEDPFHVEARELLEDVRVERADTLFQVSVDKASLESTRQSIYLRSNQELQPRPLQETSEETGAGNSVTRSHAILRAVDLKVSAQGGSKSILPKVSLQLDPGDVLFLWGESGSGKSTFIKLCLGIIPSNVTVDGTLEIPLPPVVRDLGPIKSTDNGRAPWGTPPPAAVQNPGPSPIKPIDSGRVHWKLFQILSGLFFGYCPQNPFTRFDRHAPLDDQLVDTALHEEWIGLPGHAQFNYLSPPKMHMTILLKSLFYRRLKEDLRRDVIDAYLANRLVGLLPELTDDQRSTRLEQELVNLRSLPRERSHGYVQRMSMLQGNANLSVLFMDEPFNALDLVRRRELIRYCVNLLSTGSIRALVCATHDKEVIRAFHEEVTERDGRPKTENDPEAPTKNALRCKYLAMNSARLENVFDGCDLLKGNSSQKRIGKKGEERVYNGRISIKIPDQPKKHKRSNSGKKCLHIVYDLGKEVRDMLCINSGEVVGLAGNSNCGKSSLGRYICGWQDQISFKLQYVPQNPYANFSPGVPVEDCIPARIRNKWNAFLKKAGEQRGQDLFMLVKKPPALLSGGELQRLRIFASMATDPELLFLDEPFAHQDFEWREEIVSLLADEVSSASTGTKSAIIVSHDIPFLLSVCSRVILLTDFHFDFQDGPLAITIPLIDIDLHAADKEQGKSLFLAELDKRSKDTSGVEARLRSRLERTVDFTFIKLFNAQMEKVQRHSHDLARILESSIVS